MNARVIKADQANVAAQPWGSIQWLVGGAGKDELGMTFGRVTFEPGQANPPHHHPNCDEILFVVSGAVEHSLPGGDSVRLDAGDCIVLPRGEKHHARNVGSVQAVVVVAFNAADRQTIGE